MVRERMWMGMYERTCCASLWICPEPQTFVAAVANNILTVHDHLVVARLHRCGETILLHAIVRNLKASVVA